MTAAEYAAAYRAARVNTSKLTRKTLLRMRSVYLDAAAEAARQMAAAELAGYATITQRSWAQIEAALIDGAREVQRVLDSELPLAVDKVASGVTSVDARYLTEIVARSGAGLDPVLIENLFVGVNDKVVRSLVARVFSDGYTYSERIWRVGAGYQDAMKRVITSGLSAGRDVIDVAADLNAYVRSGRAGLMRRWGDLVRGNSDFARRIRKDVDYNALRLVRSELYASLQEASRLDGQLNPACTGLYDWVRYNTTDWGCDCPDLAAGGPYREEDLPAYPHPQCECQVRPRLMDSAVFLEDLKRFSRGEEVGYLDKWYRESYRGLAAA